MAHREILVRQAYEKLVKVWPEAELQVGLACAGASSRVEVDRPVVIGSPQTLCNRLGEMPPVHLLIIDECHRVPSADRPSQYRELIQRLEAYYPQLRVLGVTATPFRLGHGFIHGRRCKPGARNWWPRLHYQVSMAELIEAGFLAPYRALEALDIEADLARLKRTGGDYNQGQLEAVMTRPVHIDGAVEAYRRWGEGRQHVVVFCVSIRHAELVAEAFAAAGLASGVVHSELPRARRMETLERFESGRLQVVANVGVLTEGWDSAAVDCLLLCRPTLSPALYVQIVGRGLRTCPGKADLLILDLSGNCRQHGDPNDPHVRVPDGKKQPEDQANRFKACPQCQHLLPPAARVCSYCGHAWPEDELVDAGAPLDMRALSWTPQRIKVLAWSVDLHRSLRGHVMLRLDIDGQNGGPPLRVSHYLDIEGASGLFARGKARETWLLLAGSKPPASLAEAMDRRGEIKLPPRVMIKRNGKYLNVVRWN